MGKIVAVINSTHLTARSASDSVQLVAHFSEGEDAHIEVSTEEDRSAVIKALTDKVWRDQGGPILF